ncbi:oligosaccharide flippase family protein [Loktanella sp. S4079]|uniref:oligosaccharide flippase family protein n=1 Tax=Loktanella sp. S4079 TaxID=579483 RepID=UPI0005FA0FDE|nr:oligosaccharide flippase family protein [Loktanella sp. S4079]KJZ18626.1 hypothetical protein TW80_14595 [Loktanella sp. S4079]
MRAVRLKSTSDSFFASVSQLISARALMMLLQFLSLPILARLLSVEDFAIMSLGMVVPLFANTFSDAGFGRSLIRAQRYDVDEWSTVFWFLGGVGLLLGLAVAAIAPIYASSMNQPGLVAVILVLSLMPMLQSFLSVHQAAIERDFRFDVMSGVIGVSGVTSVAAAVALAYLGAGYWALIAQQVLLVAIRFIGVMSLSPFRPKFVFRRALLRPHLRFGVNTLLFSGVMVLHAQAPVIAFNQLFGTFAVSLWAMVERVSRFPRLGVIGPLAQVAMVSMSRQWRDGEGRADVARSYVSAMRLLAVVLFPGMLVLAMNGRPVFTWLLSDRWADMAFVFGLAVPAFLVDMMTSVGARVFMVADRTDLRLRMAIERFVLGITVFLCALPYGFEQAVIARSVFAVLYMPRYWSYMNRCVPISIREGAAPMIVPTVVGLIFGLAVNGLVGATAWGNLTTATAVLGLCIVASAAAGLVTWRAIKRDIQWLQGSTAVVNDR